MSAKNIAALAVGPESDQARDQDQQLDTVYHKLRTQLNQGKAEPVAPFTLASVLGEKGVELVKERLEQAFGAAMTIEIDLIANTIKALPAAKQPDEDLARDPSDLVQSLSKTKTKSKSKSKSKATIKGKVARPPNAFILYRKDWHAKVVSENPDLHNNGISVIIGDKWQNESDAVKAEYKLKASLASMEHAALHPNYTYQPRKPSERKKRMTKSKLAKIQAAEVVEAPVITFDHTAKLATFNTGTDLNDGLATQFQDGGYTLWYDQTLTLPPTMPARQNVPVVAAAEHLFNTSGDMLSANVMSFPIEEHKPVNFVPSTTLSDMAALAKEYGLDFFLNTGPSAPDADFAGAFSSAGLANGCNAEIAMQDRLQGDMNQLFFDFDEAADEPSTA